MSRPRLSSPATIQESPQDQFPRIPFPLPPPVFPFPLSPSRSSLPPPIPHFPLLPPLPVHPSPNAPQRFPLKAAATASGLALAGDTLAQLVERRSRQQQQQKQQQHEHGSHRRHHADARCAAATAPHDQHVVPAGEGAGEGVGHDWVRAVRMASYGFLLYGPGCHAWYRWLDRLLPAPTASNFALKVVANQVVVGPSVLLVVFAWNMAWMGRARDIPDKYRRDLFPSLIKGYKFWIPATCLNFAVVPLEARVAFMSCCAIFWNFHLSSSLGKEAPRPAPQRTSRPAAPLSAPASSPDYSPAATASAGYQVFSQSRLLSSTSTPHANSPCPSIPSCLPMRKLLRHNTSFLLPPSPPPTTTTTTTASPALYPPPISRAAPPSLPRAALIRHSPCPSAPNPPPIPSPPPRAHGVVWLPYQAAQSCGGGTAQPTLCPGMALVRHGRGYSAHAGCGSPVLCWLRLTCAVLAAAHLCCAGCGSPVLCWLRLTCAVLCWLRLTCAVLAAAHLCCAGCGSPVLCWLRLTCAVLAAAHLCCAVLAAAHLCCAGCGSPVLCWLRLTCAVLAAAHLCCAGCGSPVL
ncbi:unnamed protein product, partial [Closterium sp. NIES-64]